MDIYEAILEKFSLIRKRHAYERTEFPKYILYVNEDTWNDMLSHKEWQSYMFGPRTEGSAAFCSMPVHVVCPSDHPPFRIVEEL